MAISRTPWSDFSESDYPDAETFCNACLIDSNPPGQPKTKADCKLPIKEPNGDINVGGVHAAASALAGARGGLTGVSAAVKRTAARKLVRAYGQINQDAPDSIKRMANG